MKADPDTNNGHTLNMNMGDAVQNNKLLRPLMGIPVFYKVLIANSFIIFVGATGGTWLASQLHTRPNTPIYLVVFVALGWLVSVVLNFVVLQVAFRPLMDLGKVMSRIQKGERSLRAPLTGIDPQADMLARTCNMMLEAIDEANRLRASQIINAQEQERKRVARELHDETSQVLTSLLISLALLEETVKTDEARQRIAETRTLAHQTLRTIRNLSIDLRPSALDDLGLLPALRWYMKEYQQKFPLEVNVQATGFKKRLPAEVETALYRIVQESLTNIAKHAHAHTVRVTLREDAEAAYATICDDGKGFDVEQLQLQKIHVQDRGLGLVGMYERAHLLAGSLTINSTPGKGAIIQVRIPLYTTNRAIDDTTAERPILSTPA